jgi:glycosyltransferase involved in cell wall biosynthesis
MLNQGDQRDSYCRSVEALEYCDRINNFTTENFCECACRGNYKGWIQESIEERRNKMRKPLTGSEKRDDRLVSVIIPIWERDKVYLDRTVKSVQENAGGPIEILTETDEKNEGHRVLTNRMASKAKGEFLFRLDCHCKMEPEWDLRMKASCRRDCLVVPMLDGLDESTWELRHKDMGFVCLSPCLENMWPLKWKPIYQRNVEEETISIVGCAYMVHKDDFLRRQGCDESLGTWGYAGPEISLKFHLTNGFVYVRTDTVVGHVFRGKANPFGITNDQYLKTGKKLFEKLMDGREYGLTRPLEWLMDRFPKYFKAGIRTDGKNFRPIPNA